MPFESLRRILPKAVQKAGITKQVTAARVIEEWTAMLKDLWGEEKAARIEGISFKDGVLKVKARSGPASQELKIHKTRLINQLNRTLGSRVVQKLEVRN